VSQKLTEQVEKELEKLRDNIDHFFRRLNETNSKADKRRYRYSIMKFYEVMLKAGREEYKQDYEDAKAKYDSLFLEEVFSINRKT